MNNMNCEYKLQDIKNLLKEKLDKGFTIFGLNDKMYGFEGEVMCLDGSDCFYRFGFNFEIDKYALFFIQRKESVETLSSDVTFEEAIESYLEHYDNLIKTHKKKQVKSIKKYLKQTLNRKFSFYQCDDNIFGFEGKKIYFEKADYFYRFMVDLQTDKYSLFFIKKAEFVKTIERDTSLEKVVKSYERHYQKFMNKYFNK